MSSAITRLMAVAAVAAALLLVAAMSLAQNASSTGTGSSTTVRPAAPATHTVATASRFSPHGRRWI